MNINGQNYGKIILAPMAGVTEVGFRRVCKMAGADVTETEMINANALLHDSDKTKDLLVTTEIEQPKIVQIFGHDPEVMAHACSSNELLKFDMIDINFGCPAPKIVKNGDGSALLKNLKLVEKIVSSCVKATSKPVACKFRIGFEENTNVALDMAKICEDSGAKLITVHGRTRDQMYSGNVDLETITKVKSVSKICVVGNGDITDLESFNKMLSTGVDAVMVGRGALGNPNIFAELKGVQKLNKFSLVQEHVKTLRKFFDEKYVSATMRKHLLWYIAGIEDATKYKLQIATSPNLDDALMLVQSLIEKNN